MRAKGVDSIKATRIPGVAAANPAYSRRDQQDGLVDFDEDVTNALSRITEFAAKLSVHAIDYIPFQL